MYCHPRVSTRKHKHINMFLNEKIQSLIFRDQSLPCQMRRRITYITICGWLRKFLVLTFYKGISLQGEKLRNVEHLRNVEVRISNYKFSSCSNTWYYISKKQIWERYCSGHENIPHSTSNMRSMGYSLQMTKCSGESKICSFLGDLIF